MAEVKEQSTKDIGQSFTPTILIVDDDETVIEAVQASLENENYNVISAGSGKEALEKFDENEVDIIVTDIRMPEVDGLELLKRVKDRSPATKVIMMTAYASVDSAVEAMREGASDYIRKPIEVKDIRTTILGAVENLELEQYKEKTNTIRKGRGEGKPYETFANLVERGKRGLCFFKTKPKNLKGLEEKIELIKLSKEGIEPRNLDRIKETIQEKISQHGSLVILVDDLDYLLEYNSIDEIEKFINSLEKDIVGKNSTLIISGKMENIEEEYEDELEYMASDIPARIISDSLSNHIRRKVITELSKYENKASFTTLSKETGIDDSPKLSFHLKKLESAGLIEKDREKRYRLTEAGENAAETLEKLREVQGEGFGQITWIPK